MKAIIKKGATSQLVQIFVQDSSSTTGAGLTGLTSGSSGLVCYRARGDDGNAAGTALTLSGGTRGTWSSGGFVEKDATNMPGLYELGLDNAGLVTGVDRVIYMLKGATNMAPLAFEVELVPWDIQAANLPANATQFAGQTITAAAGVTIPTSIASPTNITAASGVALAAGQKVDVDTIKTNPVVNAGTVTFPTGATLASTTNITAAVGITVATNSDKTGYSLTQTFPSNFSSMSIDASGNVAQTSNIKKNTAKAGFMFVMTDSTTHAPKTGVTVTSTRSIDGAAFASTTNSATEVAVGTYVLNLSAADTNGDHIMLRFTGTASDDLNIEIVTQP